MLRQTLPAAAVMVVFCFYQINKQTKLFFLFFFLASAQNNVVNESKCAKDLSVFRTPSGYFYCKLCNMSLNSSAQFTQHLNSKNHAKKVTQNNNI